MTDFPSPEELKLRRNADGEVEPVVATSPQTGRKYLVRPVTYGESLAYDDPFASPLEWGPQEKAKLIREHMIEPDLSDVDADSLQSDFSPQDVNDMVTCIGLYSGIMRKRGEQEASEAGKASP